MSNFTLKTSNTAWVWVGWTCNVYNLPAEIEITPEVRKIHIKCESLTEKLNISRQFPPGWDAVDRRQLAGIMEFTRKPIFK